MDLFLVVKGNTYIVILQMIIVCPPLQNVSRETFNERSKAQQSLNIQQSTYTLYVLLGTQKEYTIKKGMTYHEYRL